MNTRESVSTNIGGVIFDISGTTLDFGSRGPVAAFVELFARHGVAVSHEEARGPMGTHKRDHIWTILKDPAIGQRWEDANGAKPDQALLDRLYEEFAPLQKEVLKDYCDVIPGVPEVLQELRSRGIMIANTTGFDSGMIEDLVKLAAQGGYAPDLWVCPDMVGGGRPAPWMAFHVAQKLNIYPLSRFVKVGDTPADVAEAHSAGMWAVSVVRSGNEVGLSESELASLEPSERDQRIATARARLTACGPHYVIETVADLLPVIDDVSARIARGERP